MQEPPRSPLSNRGRLSPPQKTNLNDWEPRIDRMRLSYPIIHDPEPRMIGGEFSRWKAKRGVGNVLLREFRHCEIAGPCGSSVHVEEVRPKGGVQSELIVEWNPAVPGLNRLALLAAASREVSLPQAWVERVDVAFDSYLSRSRFRWDLRQNGGARWFGVDHNGPETEYVGTRGKDEALVYDLHAKLRAQKKPVKGPRTRVEARSRTRLHTVVSSCPLARDEEAPTRCPLRLSDLHWMEFPIPKPRTLRCLNWEPEDFQDPIAELLAYTFLSQGAKVARRLAMEAMPVAKAESFLFSLSSDVTENLRQVYHERWADLTMSLNEALAPPEEVLKAATLARHARQYASEAGASEGVR